MLKKRLPVFYIFAKIVLTRKKKRSFIMEKRQQRWYDADPVLSRAIAVWEKADEELQTICAEYVLDKLKDFDFKMSLEDQYNYMLRRWYDKNIKVSHAMEYIKHAPFELRHELALNIIEYIEKMEEENKKKKKNLHL